MPPNKTSPPLKYTELSYNTIKEKIKRPTYFCLCQQGRRPVFCFFSLPRPAAAGLPFAPTSKARGQSAPEGAGDHAQHGGGVRGPKGRTPRRRFGYHDWGCRNGTYRATGAPVSCRPSRFIVHCSCKLSADTDAPTTILADGPPPLPGRTLGPYKPIIRAADCR